MGQSAEQRLERLLELQALLADVSHRIGPALELAPVLQTVLDAMRSLVEFRGGSICLVDDRGVYVAAADEDITPEMAGARVPVGTGLAGRAVATGEPVYSPDLDNDDRVDPNLRRLRTNLPTKSYLGVPLVCLGRVIGVLQVDSVDTDAFMDEDHRLLQGLAMQVAGAIESARHNEEIRNLERLKSDFLARVSHELRTPLTIISGFADTLANHSADIDDGQRVQMLERIRDASVRLHGLIDELLTVNQFEIVEPRAEQVAVIDVLDGVRSRAVDPERVRVVADRNVTLVTDPRILGHVLTLLVDNALKYAGDVELRAGADVISVRDHGPGIPEALRADLFERFTRGDHTTPGMGLGLPVARALAQSLGATLVHVDPDDPDGGGGGACFELRFSVPGC
ncbi:MAG: GAF domain-containing protein [Actinobacteria bacterium]|nr:GAF domain-containing protein [Actinomycetota bacterium]